MGWSQDHVHDDLVVSADGTSVHRTSADGWHAIVGEVVFRTGVHTFTIEVVHSWAIGVVDAEMRFGSKRCGWHVIGMLWDGSVGTTKDGASNDAPGFSTPCLDLLKRAGGHMSKRALQMKVDFPARKLLFRSSESSRWHKVHGTSLPSSVRLWACLGEANLPIVVKAKTSQGEWVDKGGLHASLARDIGTLCCSEENADVSIVVGDERIPAHSAVLAARSNVFAGMLRAPMRESLTREILLEDVEGPVAREILHFIYAGGADSETLAETAFATALLLAANRFELPALEELCAKRLRGQLQVDTVADVLTTADAIGCAPLRKACLDFLAKHLDAAQKTPGFKRLVEKRPALMMDFVAVIAPRVKKNRTK